MNATRSGSFGDSQSAWLTDCWIVGLLKQKVRKILDTTDLLEVVEELHGHASTIVTIQLPVENCHEQIGDPTIADAILDRLIHTMLIKYI